MTISKSYYGLLSVKSKQSLGMISVDELRVQMRKLWLEGC